MGFPYRKMADVEYHALDILSQSRLKDLHLNQFAQWVAITKSKAKMKSDSLRIGSVMHAVNLQGASIESFPIFPNLDGRTAAGKAQKAGLANLELYLYEDELHQCGQMRRNFLCSEEAQGLMEKCLHIEEAAVADIPTENLEHDLEIKFKPDAIGPDFILDFKTISDYANDRNVVQAMRSYDYVFQAGAYSYLDQIVSGHFKENFFHIFQETIEPYGVRVVKMQPHLVMRGVERFVATLNKYLDLRGTTDPNYRGVKEINFEYY